MEFSSQETFSSNKSGAGMRRSCTIVFVVAVVAVLVYASQREHDFTTLAILCTVLLIGEILAAYQWYREAKREAINDAAPRILEAFDMRMKQSFANQEIIHKEVHKDFEALSKQLAAIENALKYLANRQEENAKIADKTASGEADFAGELSDGMDKLREKIDEISKEISGLLDAQTATLQERLSSAKSEHQNLDGINERLEIIAEAQDEILEKLEAFPQASCEDAEASADDFFIGEETDEALPADGDDSAFPLPPNLFERAQSANAESVASAVAKLICDVPAKTQAAESKKRLLVIEYFSAEESAPKEEPAESSEQTDDGTEDEPASEHRPISEGELPLIEDLPHTALILKAGFGSGERPYLRGNAPGLSPKKSVPMDYSGSDTWRFDFGPMKEDAKITIFRNDTNEALGAPFKLRAGKVTTLAFSPNS